MSDRDHARRCCTCVAAPVCADDCADAIVKRVWRWDSGDGGERCRCLWPLCAYMHWLTPFGVRRRRVCGIVPSCRCLSAGLRVWCERVSVCGDVEEVSPSFEGASSEGSTSSAMNYETLRAIEVWPLMDVDDRCDSSLSAGRVPLGRRLRARASSASPDCASACATGSVVGAAKLLGEPLEGIIDSKLHVPIESDTPSPDERQPSA